MSAPSSDQLDRWCEVLGIRLVEVSRPPVLAALVGLLRHMGYGVIPSQALTRMHRDLTAAWASEHGSSARELLFASATGALSAHVGLTSGREDFGEIELLPGVPASVMATDNAASAALDWSRPLGAHDSGAFHQGSDGYAHHGASRADCRTCTPP